MERELDLVTDLNAQDDLAGSQDRPTLAAAGPWLEV